MLQKLYLIGNAHIDPVWLWRWQEGFSEVLATFRSALDRMNDFPDFKFTSAASVYYELIEKMDPAMFEEIDAKIRAMSEQIDLGDDEFDLDEDGDDGDDFDIRTLGGDDDN